MSEWCGMRMTRPTFAGFGERGRGRGTKEGGQPLGDGKGKEMILPYSFQKELQPCQHLDFSPTGLTLDF